MEANQDNEIDYESFFLTVNSKEYPIIIRYRPSGICIQILSSSLGIIESSRFFSLTDFYDLSSAFYLHPTIKEVYDYICSLFKDNKVEGYENTEYFKLILLVNLSLIDTIPIIISKKPQDAPSQEIPQELIYNQDQASLPIRDGFEVYEVLHKRIEALEQELKNDKMKEKKNLKRLDEMELMQEKLIKKYETIETMLKFFSEESSKDPMKQKLLKYLIEKKEESNCLKLNDNNEESKKTKTKTKSQLPKSQISILSNKDCSILLDWISPLHKYRLTLQYNPIIGDDSYAKAQEKTQNISPLLVLIETDINHCRFGVFTTNQSKNNVARKNQHSFIFSLDKYYKYSLDHLNLSIYFDSINRHWNLFIFTLNDNFMSNSVNSITPKKASLDYSNTLKIFNDGKDYFRVYKCMVYSLDYIGSTAI